MPEITNPHNDPMWVPALGRVVEPGETVDAPADTAKSLVAQGWDKVTKSAKKKTDDDEQEA